MQNFSDIELPSNRKFGLFFTLIFVICGAYFFSKKLIIMAMIFFGIAILFLITILVKPEFLFPLNKLWLKLGLFLGMVVNPILLSVIFFGLITPIALIMRLFGRDELRLKIKNRKSYWKPKVFAEHSLDTFKNQF